MDNSMSPRLLIFVAAFFALLAGVIWAVFLRPVPTQTASGIITKKTFKPAGTYWQFPAGLNRGFQLATPIPIAEAYVFEFKMDRFEGPVFFSLSPNASGAFQVGQKVEITYRERVIPFYMRRLYVLEMTAN